MPNMANVGYPIIEAEPDGSFTITKHLGTGGRVHSHVIKEQLLYELGDPRNYITPDCVADFTSIRLTDTGPDRVRVSGIRGGRRPESLKLSISYENGWKAIGTLVYSWPESLEKALWTLLKPYVLRVPVTSGVEIEIRASIAPTTKP